MSDIFSQGLMSNPALDTMSFGIGGNSEASLDDRFSKMMEKNLKTASQAAAESTDSLPGKNSITIDKESKLYEQCEALEVFLLKNMINGMRKTITKSNLIDTGFAGNMYEDMLYDEYAKDFAENAAMGFADMAYLELTGQRGKVIDQKF
jgi:flagellar protein FlgJ